MAPYVLLRMKTKLPHLPEACTTRSHSCMLCVHENQTCWQKGIAADPQFPQHSACMLPAELRDEGLSQETPKGRSKVGAGEAGGQTLVPLEEKG